VGQQSQRIVVKLGTQVVVEQETGSIALDRVCAVVDDIAKLRQRGIEVILVSSGAVGLGRQAFALSGALELHQKQACAAVGQTRLMSLYSELFKVYGVTVAQILVTASDFTNRRSYVNLRNSFECLLELGTVPIVNENDVVSVACIKISSDKAPHEKSFDDNDKLSAVVAGKISAQTLVILTNFDGVYTDNPGTNPQATRIPRVATLSQLAEIDCRGQSALGRGGMASKLEAARIAAMCGVRTIISSADRQHPLLSAFDEENGTVVDIRSATLRGRERWIGVSSGFSGVVTIDDRAKETLERERCSLLPVGVLAVEGDFDVGEVVSIVGRDGHEIARGVASQRSASLRAVAGKRSPEAKALLRDDEKEEVVHRDNLVFFGAESDVE